jgi:hypothetical protein
LYHRENFGVKAKVLCYFTDEYFSRGGKYMTLQNCITALSDDSPKYYDLIKKLLETKCSHKQQVEFAYYCAVDYQRYYSGNKETDMCLKLVKQWLTDSSSVSSEELRAAANTADAAYTATAAAYAAVNTVHAAARIYSANAANAAAHAAYAAATATAAAATAATNAAATYKSSMKRYYIYLVKLVFSDVKLLELVV